jgi:hypothetical protein
MEVDALTQKIRDWVDRAQALARITREEAAIINEMCEELE